LREREIAALIAQGLRNKEIAWKMKIDDQTVKNHLHRIFVKLGFSNRLDLALYAVCHNIQAPATLANMRRPLAPNPPVPAKKCPPRHNLPKTLRYVEHSAVSPTTRLPALRSSPWA